MGLRRAVRGAKPGPGAAGPAPRLRPPSVCGCLLLRICRALPGPGSGLRGPRAPNQRRRVRDGAGRRQGDGVPGGFEDGCGEGGLGRAGQGPRRKVENNRTETDAQGTFGSSESSYFEEVEDPRGTIITVIMADVFWSSTTVSGKTCVNG